jgi:hypothetical protein
MADTRDLPELAAFAAWADKAQSVNKMTPYERIWAWAAWKGRAELAPAQVVLPANLHWAEVAPPKATATAALQPGALVGWTWVHMGQRHFTTDKAIVDDISASVEVHPVCIAGPAAGK